MKRGSRAPKERRKKVSKRVDYHRPIKVNAYTCPAGHRIVTIETVEGVTPFMIACREDGCGERAQSSFYRVSPAAVPTHEWYRMTEKEAKKSRGYFDHWKQGGLSLRPVWRGPK